jgi:peptidoglycan/xylan/chitin deacetylase (PgdA/CDA1 family)
MKTWKSKLIETYRFLSLPYRHFSFSKMCRDGTVPVYVLFYHRIADEFPNPWTISRDGFAQQIDWIQENFEIVDLQECQRRIQSGKNSRPTVAITFDDGYAENCEFGLPYLIERRIPVTYFVSLDQTKNQTPFQHDVDRGQPLPTNTIESLRALDMAGIEIGAHTRTHPDLGAVTSEQELLDETLVATLELEQLIGRKIRYFAFPYGQTENLPPNVFSILKNAGLLGVCSAYGGWNEIGDDSFHIQRLHGDPSLTRMKNWLTYDPRIAGQKRFDYSDGHFDPRRVEEAIGLFRDVGTEALIPTSELPLPGVSTPYPTQQP